MIQNLLDQVIDFIPFQNCLYIFAFFCTWILDSAVKIDAKYSGEFGGKTLNLLSLKQLTLLYFILSLMSMLCFSFT